MSDKPFVVVQATHYSDSPPQELPERLQLAALELRVWQVRRSQTGEHELQCNAQHLPSRVQADLVPCCVLCMRCKVESSCRRCGDV